MRILAGILALYYFVMAAVIGFTGYEPSLWEIVPAFIVAGLGLASDAFDDRLS